MPGLYWPAIIVGRWLLGELESGVASSRLPCNNNGPGILNEPRHATTIMRDRNYFWQIERNNKSDYGDLSSIWGLVWFDCGFVVVGWS